MVDIIIYVEGAELENSEVQTVDNSATLRENFYKLFSQRIPSTEFNLKINPFGSVTQVRKILERIEAQDISAVLLIDLDAPKAKRGERLCYYSPSETGRIFFMIQEMEAWILAQIDKIEQKFGEDEGLIRKKTNESIRDNLLLKGKHPEQIDKPSEKLDTIFRQYFDIVKVRRGHERRVGKRYSKAKDGPKLIGLLDLEALMQCFDEAKRLVAYIKK